MNIQVKSPLGHTEYTPEELKKELDDLAFLRDAFLVILNPKALEENWDIPYSEEEAKEYAKEMYESLDYDKDFLEKVFEN